MRLANMFEKCDKEHVVCSGYRELRKSNKFDTEYISVFFDDRSCVAEMKNSKEQQSW